MAFFVLSGFLMSLLVCETYKGRIRAFAMNRFLRLYPTYWFTMLLMALLLWLGLPLSREDVGIPPLAQLIPDILYVNYWKDNPQLLLTSWAVTNEIVFYCLIALGISASQVRALVWLFISIIMYFVVQVFSSAESDLRYFSPVAASLPFAIGAVAYHFRNVVSAANIVPLGIVAGAAMLLCIFIDAAGVTKPPTQLLFLLATAFFTLSLFHSAKKARALKWVDDQIGALSYPVYLNHFGAMMVALLLVERSAQANFILYTVVISLALAMLNNIVVDVPINKVRNSLRRS